MTAYTAVSNGGGAVGSGFVLGMFVFASVAVDWCCNVYRRRDR